MPFPAMSCYSAIIGMWMRLDDDTLSFASQPQQQQQQQHRRHGTTTQHTIHINFSFTNNSKRIEIIKISIFTLNLNSTRIIISCATRVFLIYYG